MAELDLMGRTAPATSPRRPLGKQSSNNMLIGRIRAWPDALQVLLPKLLIVGAGALLIRAQTLATKLWIGQIEQVQLNKN